MMLTLLEQRSWLQEHHLPTSRLGWTQTDLYFFHLMSEDKLNISVSFAGPTHALWQSPNSPETQILIRKQNTNSHVLSYSSSSAVLVRAVSLC